MKKSPVEFYRSNSSHQTETELQDDERSNANLVKKLRLKFESIQTLPLNNLRNTNEIVNYLLDLFNQLDSNLLDKFNTNTNASLNELLDAGESSTAVTSVNNSNSFKSQLLDVVIRHLEFLITKLKTASNSSSGDLISIVILLLQLVRKNYHPTELVNFYKNLIGFLKCIKNDNVINEILNFWTLPDLELEAIRDTLLTYLKRNLSNKDHRIRSKCLKILAYNYSKDRKLLNNKIMKVVFNFNQDQDPRVRMTSIELMIMFHINGISVPVEYYETIKANLCDDFERVRLLSTQLICLLAFSYPEYMISLSDRMDEEKIRLADDVFSKMCFMINDISLDVRVCASNLLGKIDLVSSKFLLQTLDKKLMSDLKLRKTVKSRQKQLVANEWATSTSTATESSADSVITEEDNLTLMASGACGAFIHGLEDEFLEVRAESVDALCNLAVKCPKLAAKSIDFLVDMFNDEIELVRLKAILALGRVLHFVLLGDDQIDIVVSVIEDSSFNVRESLKDLLSSCKIATKIGLKKTIQALFNNLRKYIIDKNSIWRCFKNLGKNHSKFVLSLVSYLVSLHPFIDVVEPDINDLYYISSLILIFNAVNENSAILPLLPRYVINHYFFLKLKLPDLIPDITLIENYPNSISNTFENQLAKCNKVEELQRFFVRTKNNLKLINLAEDLSENKLKIYESLSQDIDYLSHTDSNISVACEIMKNFIHCCLVIKKRELSFFKEKTDSQKLIEVEEALITSIRLIIMYKGYSIKEKIVLLKLYLYLRAIYLKELYNRKSVSNANVFFNHNINSYLKINIRKDLVKECHLYLSLIDFFDKILDKNFKHLIFKIIEKLPIEFGKTRAIEASNSVEKKPNAFDIEFLMLSEKPNNYARVWLELLEPLENFEAPIRFTPGLVSSIRVKAVLHNFTRFDNLFIQVTYTDNDKQFIPIDMNSIKQINDEKHVLETIIYLSNLALTDNCSIKICITMLIDEYKSIKENILENIDQSYPLSDVNNTSPSSSSTLAHTSRNNTYNLHLNVKSFKNNLNPIELSKHVKIFFEPLAKKFY